MVNRFVISDTHFGHSNILNFKDKDGNPVRSFSSVEEMDQTIIDNWNKIVQPQDVVYHLGDVAINKKYIETVGRCNGHKRLILGNHDIYDLKWYQPFFEKILAMRVFGRQCVMIHIPIHPESVGRFSCCIHGHIHNNSLKETYGMNYFNASVEMVNYQPYPLDLILDKYGQF